MPTYLNRKLLPRKLFDVVWDEILVFSTTFALGISRAILELKLHEKDINKFGKVPLFFYTFAHA